MSLHHIANHLAAKGRNGDSTLVHMTKDEVAGLQALAKAHGKSLTVNPKTGLPEAFGLRQLMPMAAGAALTIGSGGALGPVAAGLMVGGASAVASGNLKQGIVDGLGAWGGAGLGAGVGVEAAGAEGAAGAGAGGAPVFEPPITPIETIQAGGQSSPATEQFLPVAEPATTSVSAPVSAGDPIYSGTSTNTIPQLKGPTSPGGEMMSDMGQSGASTQATTTAQPTGNMDARATYDPTFKASTYSGPTEASLGEPSKFQQVAANAEANPKYIAGALAPGMVDEMTPKPYAPPAANGGDADMGQRYEYKASDQYSSPSYEKIGNADAKKLYGYAEGGDVQYPYGEAVLRMASGGDTGSSGLSGYGSYTAQDANVAAHGLGTGIDYTGYDTAPNQGTQTAQYSGNGSSSNSQNMYLGDGQYESDDKAFLRAFSELDSPIADFLKMALKSYAQGGGVEVQPGLEQLIPPHLRNALRGSVLKPQEASEDQQQYATGGGISTLGSYSDGGRLLKGPGDGMSDNIPAKIGNKQPARLADGEFVVPADVVSHLGNGSTDAGAKQLYKMMDKIRAARTGRKAQGKQINPSKYMPA